MTSNPEMVDLVEDVLLKHFPMMSIEMAESAAPKILEALSPLYVERPVWSDEVPKVEDWYFVEWIPMWEGVEVVWFKPSNCGEELNFWGVIHGRSGYHHIETRDLPVIKWAPCPAPMED